jgi:Ni,Fe-hydrogenase III small subunit
MEVDRAVADADADDLSTMLIRKTSHSVLAWRTIHWVCSTDNAACDSVETEVLETTKLAGGTKGYSGDIAKPWSPLPQESVVISYGRCPYIGNY